MENVLAVSYLCIIPQAIMILLKRLHMVSDTPVLLAHCTNLQNGPHLVFCNVTKMNGKQLKDAASSQTQQGLAHKTQRSGAEGWRWFPVHWVVFPGG